MPYITPDTLPSAWNCRRLLVPDDTRMLAAILGQLLELTEPVNWEETTGITVNETVEFWQSTFDRFSLGDFCMIGAVVAILNDTIPDSMLLCDGSSFAKVDFPELYAVLPSVLIVDSDNGQTPDLRETFVMASGTSISDHDTGGAATHQLTESEMPSHRHVYDKEIYNIDVESIGIPDPSGVGIPPLPTNTSSKGGDDPHNNIPPFYALKYAVVAR